MPYIYTNRKGQKFYLCRETTKTGRARYTLVDELPQDAPEHLPEGYRISENISGHVALVRDAPEWILPEEMTSIESAIARHARRRDLRAEYQKGQVIIYEQAGPDVGSLSAIMAHYSQKPAGVVKKNVEQQLEKMAHFTPLLRFTLVELEPRRFKAERPRAAGGKEWVEVGEPGKLDILARRLVPRLLE
jgi:hypothetical protein